MAEWYPEHRGRQDVEQPRRAPQRRAAPPQQRQHGHDDYELDYDAHDAERPAADPPTHLPGTAMATAAAAGAEAAAALQAPAPAAPANPASWPAASPPR